jgi:hypothetical protein
MSMLVLCSVSLASTAQCTLHRSYPLQQQVAEKLLLWASLQTSLLRVAAAVHCPTFTPTFNPPPPPTHTHTYPSLPGLAAGFDKDAEAIRGLLGTGFGFMEVGECPASSQKGCACWVVGWMVAASRVVGTPHSLVGKWGLLVGLSHGCC